jgi:hypothetical protein
MMVVVDVVTIIMNQNLLPSVFTTSRQLGGDQPT